MSRAIKHIVIVGGGSAGWLSACILASKLQLKKRNDLTITLVESPLVPTIGVGEGTVPTMRQTLQLIGVSETDFIRECDVTFKQSIRFDNWCKPVNGSQHQYHHLFHQPHRPGYDLTPYWLLDENHKPYAQSISFQQQACDKFLSPKRIVNKEYDGALDYAYHLNAGKFGQFLKTHGISKLGIKHKSLHIEHVHQDDNGNITELKGARGESISGDFFIDCSGFQSKLLRETLNVEFIDKSDQLFIDKAIALQLPYENPDVEIPPFTIATAKEAGWVWDIGLTERRGLGYVFSSKHTTLEKAEQTFAEHLSGHDMSNARLIDMKVGYVDKFWEKNCVAIGLSSGFVEPLEATALLIVEATAKLLADKLPDHLDNIRYAQNSFNQTTKYAWDRVIDFIKLHYFISNRDDSDFWLDNRNPDFAPASLLEKLEHWEHMCPATDDFFTKYEIFNLENYQYVLYGMNYKTKLDGNQQAFVNRQIATNEFEKIQQFANQLSSKLPSHRSFIKTLQQQRMSKI